MLIEWVRSDPTKKYLNLGNDAWISRCVVLTLWPRAKYFPVWPVHSVNKWIVWMYFVKCRFRWSFRFDRFLLTLRVYSIFLCHSGVDFECLQIRKLRFQSLFNNSLNFCFWNNLNLVHLTRNHNKTYDSASLKTGSSTIQTKCVAGFRFTAKPQYCALFTSLLLKEV